MSRSLSEFERPGRVEPNQSNICEIYSNYGIDTLEEFEMVIGDRMNKRGWSHFKQSETFRSALVASYQDAFLQESGKIVISDAMHAALVDASYWVMEQDPNPSSRIGTKIAPMLTQKIGYIIPAYAERGLSTTGHLRFLPDDTDSPSRPY